MTNDKKTLHLQIEGMQNIHIDIGSRVELILKQGAEWYNGYTEAPTVNPVGYLPPDDKSLLIDYPGLLATGYVAKMAPDRITLTPVWSITHKGRIEPVYGAGTYFVHGDVIFHFKKLQKDY